VGPLRLRLRYACLRMSRPRVPAGFRAVARLLIDNGHMMSYRGIRAAHGSPGGRGVSVMRREQARLTAYHCFEALGQRILLNISTSLFYCVNNVVYDIALLARDAGWERALSRVRKQYRKEDVADAVAYLKKEGFLSRPEQVSGPPRPRLRPLSTLELCVTHACNLACRYCYGRHGGANGDGGGPLYGSRVAQMPEETAIKAVDLFWPGSGGLSELNLTYFGGEPFLNLLLMRAVATGPCARAGHGGARTRRQPRGIPAPCRQRVFVCAHRACPGRQEARRTPELVSRVAGNDGAPGSTGNSGASRGRGLGGGLLYQRDRGHAHGRAAALRRRRMASRRHAGSERKLVSRICQFPHGE